MATSDRPEPGIATDDELETAADALWDAIEDTDAIHVTCDRHDVIRGRDDDATEVITVELEDGGDYRKTEVVNTALKSDAPVKLRSMDDGEHWLTFFPTNQAE